MASKLEESRSEKKTKEGVNVVFSYKIIIAAMESKIFSITTNMLHSSCLKSQAMKP